MTEWIAYYQLEPFGEERADMRAAIIASTIANVNRSKGQKAYKVEDFMPRFDRQEEQGGDPVAFARLMTLALGGQDLTTGGE